jgi:hypothetical protein
MTRKPEGLDQFQRLLGTLSQVPKKELDKAVERDARKKAAKRAKRKKRA